MHFEEGDLFDMLGGGGGGFSGGPGGGLFSMFGGGGRMGGRRGPRKGEPTVQPLPVNLEDLYKGKNPKLKLEKKVICDSCKGIGGKEGAVRTCDKCRGSGRQFITRQVGPGMIQQMAAQCDTCSGQGNIINEKDKCKRCNGKKTVQEQKILQVEIKPGMRDHQKIVFYKEGDQEPDVEPGDVILVLQTRPHDVFERKGDDLFVRKKISLSDALCGYQSVIKHLDGRDILMSTLPGEVIKPDSIRGVLGEGMPKVDSAERGNLYVIFDVEFPENHFVAEQEFEKIASCLPPRPVTKPPVGEDVEEVTLSDFDPRRYEGMGGRGGGREAYQEDNSDEEEMAGHMGGGGQSVQCAQQ